MAPRAERHPDAGDGDGGKSQKSMVAMPIGPHLESRRLFQGGAAENRMPHLCRPGQKTAHTAVFAAH